MLAETRQSSESEGSECQEGLGIQTPAMTETRTRVRQRPNTETMSMVVVKRTQIGKKAMTTSHPKAKQRVNSCIHV